jgi:hypothetical protein
MEPRSANDYDDVGAQAVLSVLLEIGQVLGAYRDRFVVIGGSVPWLLFPHAEPAHVGTLDIDLSLDAQALGDGDYRNLVEALEAAGYQRAVANMKWFQLRRTVELDAHEPVAVIVDLLMPREAKFQRNKPPLLANFAVQRADGASVAMHSFVQHKLDGTMPDGRRNTVELRVASIPALLVMKGYALAGRDKRKDAYDIYFSVREFEGGPDALADACRRISGSRRARRRCSSAGWATTSCYRPSRWTGAVSWRPTFGSATISSQVLKTCRSGNVTLYDSVNLAQRRYLPLVLSLVRSYSRTR